MRWVDPPGAIVDRVVIALADSERLNGFLAQPGGSGFRVHQAFDGRTGTVPDTFDVDSFVARYGHKPRGAEVGCAVSHVEVVSAFARADGRDTDLLLVAEDDARLPPEAWHVIDRISSRRPVPDLVLLADPFGSARHRSLMGTSQRLAQLSLLSRPVGWAGRYPYLVGPVYGRVWGTGLYLVSRRAARLYVAWMTSRGGRISWLADDYSYWARHSGVRVELVRPNLASWHGESSIRAVADAEREVRMLDTHQERGRLVRLRSEVAVRTRVGRLARGALAAFAGQSVLLYEDRGLALGVREALDARRQRRSTHVHNTRPRPGS